MQGLLTQQMKLLQQIRIVQSQRFKSIKQLHEQYSKRYALWLVLFKGAMKKQAK